MNRKQEKARAGMLAGLDAGHQQAAIDRKLAADSDRGKAVALVPLAAVHQREADTRPARAEHVLSLAESIGAIGLVQPPAIDKRSRLIAGLHRLTACCLLCMPPEERLTYWQTLEGAERLLAGKAGGDIAARLAALPAPSTLPEPLRAGQLPVRRLVDLDSVDDPGGALAAEVAENTARTAYSRAEVEDLIARLRKAGYREITGRPKRGQRALRPALELVLGVSRNTARRLLGTLPPTGKVAQEGTFWELVKAAERLSRAAVGYVELAQSLPRGRQMPNSRNLERACRTFESMVAGAVDELKLLAEEEGTE